MKKTILLLLTFIFCISCERKTEFMQSKVRTNLFLIKNPPENDSLLKKEIIAFLIKNPPEDEFSDLFYKYTSDTEYFLEDEDYDGFGAQVLSMYHDLYLASFAISKCKSDTTKLVGRFHFYGNKSNLSQLDTIIYKCK